MPHDPEAFADMVVMTVKAALAPVLERLAVSEQCNRELNARVAELSGMRDRVTAIEMKSSQVVPAEPVDLTPVIERVASAEARLSVLGDLRDRVVVMETKSSAPSELSAPVMPEPVDLSPILERVAAVEARVSAIGDLRDRVVVMETKADALTIPSESVVHAQAGPSLAELELAMRDKVEPVTKELSSIRERLVAVEARQPVPGPPGRDGQDGKDGKDGLHGKDGADGLGWDDFEEVIEDDGRTIIHRYGKGDRVKQFTHKTAVQLYRGVYDDGKTYERGDSVTWAGSEWHCNEATTTRPGDGSKAWTLKVKRGRDGRDGKDAVSTPVVSITGSNG